MQDKQKRMLRRRYDEAGSPRKGVFTEKRYNVVQKMLPMNNQ